MRGYLILPAAAFASAVILSNVCVGGLITLRPPDSPTQPTFNVTAYDSAFRPAADSNQTTLGSSALPVSSELSIAQGGSNAAITYDLTESQISLGSSLARAGSGNSLSSAIANVSFHTDYDVHYSISGQMNINGVLDQSSQSFTLERKESPFSYSSLVGQTDANTPYNMANHRNSFVIGQPSSPDGAFGGLTGTLFGGQDFVLAAAYSLMAPTSTIGGATAESQSLMSFTLRGDLNGDETVGFADLLTLAQHYGQPGAYAQGDLDGNGVVNFEDLLILAQQYGIDAATPAGAVAVPEPVGGAVLGGILLALTLRRP